MSPERPNRRTVPLAALLLGVLAGCGAQDTPDPVVDAAPSARMAGEGRMDVPGGSIWYDVAGEGDGIPLLLLHGGPGAGSRYFEPLRTLSAERPIVFYDQLGAGRSDKPSDTSLWTIERHIRELDIVRETLGLDRVHILGHSWGAMLLIEYLLTNPDGVVSATFASPLFSTARWMTDARQRVAEMPPEIQAVIDEHESAGTTDSPEYQEAMMAFYQTYLLRTDPWPPLILQTFEEMGQEVYQFMWGPSEFNATGTLRSWDRMDALPTLTLPTLFTVGEFDETFPSTVRDYASRVEGSRFVEFAGAAHLTFNDSPEESVRVMREFLQDVENLPD